LLPNRHIDVTREKFLIDHIVYASPDLDRGVQAFAAAYGIEPTPGGRHLGFGTRNALIGLGERAYLEILALDDEEDMPPSKRFLQLERGSPPRFIAWCAHANRPLQETVEIARAAGCDFGEIISMSRKRTDGSTMSWKLTSPLGNRDGVLPFYVDWGSTPNPATLLPPLLTLVSFTLAHPEPNRIRAILVALGEDEIEVKLGPAPALQVNLRR
jgi:Glyoxalase-like domain